MKQIARQNSVKLTELFKVGRVCEKTRRGTLKATWLSDSFVSQTAGHVFKATWLLVEFEFDAYSEQRSSDLLRGSSRI